MIVHLTRRPPQALKERRLTGPQDLIDRGLLCEWFIRYRLDQELGEALRYGYPLSVVVLSPMIVATDQESEARVRVGAAAARAAARGPDLIGWLERDDILVVLPHTDAAGANAAVDRWREEMIRETEPYGALKWLAASLEDAGRFRSADQFVAAALHEFRGVD